MNDAHDERERKHASAARTCDRHEQPTTDESSPAPAAPAPASAESSAPASAPAPAASRRRRRVLLVAAALVAVVLAAQTVSFMVSSLDVQGFVSFGAVSAQVEETMLDAAGNEVPVPSEAEQIDAVRAASRIVRVRNTGNEPVFVRVRLSLMGTPAPVKGSTASAAAQPVNDLATYQVGPGWVERDGWYYLPAPLEPGALSEPVITGIAFDQLEAQRRFPNGALAFDARAQYVQVDNNAATSLEAEGWPNGDE